MKQNFIFIFIAVITICNSTLNAQVIPEENVPASVIKVFNSKFKKVTDRSWHKENKTNFEAFFKQNGEAKSAVFSKNGSWVKTTMLIKVSQLSEPVKFNLNLTYPKAVYTKVVDEDSYAYLKRYYVDLIFKQKKYTVIFKPNGEIVKSTLIK